MTLLGFLYAALVFIFTTKFSVLTWIVILFVIFAVFNDK